MTQNTPTSARRPAFSGPDLCAQPARKIRDLLHRGEVSPVDLIEASATRLAQVDPVINAVVTPCPDRARRRAADRADWPGSLLGGLPIGIKDLTEVEGVRTTWGTPAMADHVPQSSDPLVERLEARGALVMGKTNTPEMGAGGNTFNAVFGPSRNPWNTALTPGGSSGGAAAALAAGGLWLCHGSDYAGSLRTPANFCGIVGLRPSLGLVGGGMASMGFVAEGTEGPMARDVLDCALMLDAMVGFDTRWPVSFPPPDVPYLDSTAQDPGRVRVAFSPDLNGFAAVTPGIEQVLHQALARSPWDITEDCPPLPRLNETFRALRCLAQAGGAGRLPERVQAQFKPALRDNIAQGRALGFDDYITAQHDRSRLYDQMHRFFETHDALACPVNGVPAFPVEVEYPTSVNGQTMGDYIDWLRFSFLATTAGLPAISVPVGFTQDGLPVGLQLIGPPRGEARLLQIAYQLEQALALPGTPIDPQPPA